MSDPTALATGRRRFLQGSAAAGASLAASIASNPIARAAHSGGEDTLRVGLVGCGGRGRSAAVDALTADPRAKLVAVADVFADRAESGLRAIGFQDTVADRVEVDADHTFSGFEAYRHVIDSGVDVVLLATPPHFRPEHLAYAVERGKHVFVEKPVAVDMAGAAAVEATCALAADKGLSIVSGLCWRYDHGVRETIARIADGEIGEVVAIESSYNTGSVWHRGNKPHWSRMEYQMRNWYYYTWLSGDFIAEQAVHSLDKCAWVLGDIAPKHAMALGGRQQRTAAKHGHIYDHFSVFYEFPTGQSVYFTCRQQDNCTNRVDEIVHGTKGKAELLAHRIWNADHEWRYRGPKPSMYTREHEEFFASIRGGTPLNDGHYMVNSTRLAILGRMAAYSGKTLRWADALADPIRLGPTRYDWTDLPEPAVAIPGREASA